MRYTVSLHVLVVCCLVGVARAFCPSQCTCVFHGRTDGAGSRSVLCNDPDMSDIPVNVPVDTVKLRVEKTAVRRIPTEAFYYLVDLRYLWITYNSISSVDTGSFYNLKLLHELRMDGNMISLFPWESLKEMPRLRTLDLHNNRLTAVPPEAVPYLVNITYLDLSSNKLSTLPPDLMDIWPPFSKAPVSNSSQKIVLGLQDNPWFCDCKISKVMEISKMADCPVVLMDLFMTCTAPENLAGVLFQRAELENCVKPTIMTSATKITSPLGSNVVLRCDTTGFPTPALSWVRPDGSSVDNTVQESPGEGIRWSIMSLIGILSKDAGNYSCRAKNVAGDAEAAIFVSVAGTLSTTLPPLMPGSGTGPTSLATTFTPATVDISNIPSLTPTVLPVTTTERPKATTTKATTKGFLKPAKIKQGGNGKRLAADEKSSKKDPSKAVKDLEIVEETADSAVLLWTVDGLPGDTPLTVVYSPYGEEDTKQTLETSAGSGKELLEGLFPGMRYSVCLVAKGSVSGKDPCVDFYTLDTGEDSGQFFVIISGIACALILPLIALLIYKILALYCKGQQTPSDEEELEKESYVKFETISMKHRTLNSRPTELWARRPTHDSERMLLCSRSSIDSQMTYKSDSSRSEYLC
ncbi:leucine-rich repeat, immunoglobulin-like domain and transmembrane domain-containing protein 3a [Eucyclogobius newberryi]|uniref:leucine-rich repeat, immunoglobulin-like domain and transmembrane domain-containing protein 3a n=1 Tax=Eucyclogobius newberryi TaxID=166745 RepID=UPI003B59C59B